jgi:hypothetical protein
MACVSTIIIIILIIIVVIIVIMMMVAMVVVVVAAVMIRHQKVCLYISSSKIAMSSKICFEKAQLTSLFAVV